MTSVKIDLTNESDEELSCRVFVDDDLYAASTEPGFANVISERFIYTQEQYDVLFEDIERTNEE